MRKHLTAIVCMSLCCLLAAPVWAEEEASSAVSNEEAQPGDETAKCTSDDYIDKTKDGKLIYCRKFHNIYARWSRGEAHRYGSIVLLDLPKRIACGVNAATGKEITSAVLDITGVADVYLEALSSRREILYAVEWIPARWKQDGNDCAIAWLRVK